MKNFICQLVGVVALIFATCGCVERTLNVTSDPPGAIVYLNDQEVGRTPFSKRFLWYGTYEVQVRKEGFATLKTKSPVIAPWWQWMPFDLVAELLPMKLEDAHSISYSLKPNSESEVNPDAVVERGQEIREQLESTRLKAGQSASVRDK